jgi:hypothetical protein
MTVDLRTIACVLLECACMHTKTLQLCAHTASRVCTMLPVCAESTLYTMCICVFTDVVVEN